MFQDRRDAGRQLAVRLAEYVPLRPMVVAMPRGGVLVAVEIADALAAPLDILCVRKLGVPWQPELGIGAIAEGGIRVLNDGLIHDAGVRAADVEQVTIEETAELARRVKRYRGDRPATPVGGRTVILVDDGLATGYTARAAIQALRIAGAERVVLAVPVAPRRAPQPWRTWQTTWSSWTRQAPSSASGRPTSILLRPRTRKSSTDSNVPGWTGREPRQRPSRQEGEMDDVMSVALDERAEDELELQEAGSTFVLGAEGWEAGDYIDPEDDWSLLEDGSYLSPDETVRSWPLVGPEPL